MTDLQPYVAEFVGTVVFLVAVLLVVTKVKGPKWWVALLIGLGLAVGIYVCFLMKGPGFQNPAVAVALSMKDGRSAGYLSGMIAAELLAIAVVMLLFYAITNTGKNALPYVPPARISESYVRRSYY